MYFCTKKSIPNCYAISNRSCIHRNVDQIVADGEATWSGSCESADECWKYYGKNVSNEKNWNDVKSNNQKVTSETHIGKKRLGEFNILWECRINWVTYLFE